MQFVIRHPEAPTRSVCLEGRRPDCCSIVAVYPSRAGYAGHLRMTEKDKA
jgi:hypothetical protein